VISNPWEPSPPFPPSLVGNPLRLAIAARAGTRSFLPFLADID